jgi:uncharacterized repeat protein (TIGR03803 family)
MDAAGNLFGTAGAGGAKNHGVAFELKPDARKTDWKYRKLYAFCHLLDCADGSWPKGSVILDTAGSIYGATSYSAGLESGNIFRLGADGSFTLLVEFSTDSGLMGLTYAGASSGAPYDGTSPLYGTLSTNVFSLTPNGGTWTLGDVYDFCAKPACSDGMTAIATPLLDGSGKLFGTTVDGGFSFNGVLYRLSARQGRLWKEETLHSFCSNDSCADGAQPAASLVQDASGTLIGTAPSGGKSGQGVVFAHTRAGRFDVLYSFCAQNACADGAVPEAGVTLNGAGEIFGTTTAGGTAGEGTIFKLARGSETVLYSFCTSASCPDGQQPAAQLLIDAQGNLFGATAGGGTHGQGVVFELSP